MSLSRDSIRGLTCYIPSKAYEGYTLYAPTDQYSVWLIDMKGNFVHNWEVPYYAGCYGKLLPNGNLLFAGMPLKPILPHGGIGGKLIELNWNGEVVWEYDDPYMHHDFSRLPNGNTMILRYVKTPLEIAAKLKGGLPGTELDGVVWADAFQEITPEGKVVWEWISYEHVDLNISMCPLCPRSEWLHTNTCHVLPNGNILTSLLRLNHIAIIDKTTKEVKWYWGGDGKLGHQHDPNMLENGNVLVFDNGTHRPHTNQNYSRVLEINPKTDEIVWEFREDNVQRFHSSIISGAQRLPNGNTLICEGTAGRFFEVTPDKELVWEYIHPFQYENGAHTIGFNNHTFRAYRYSPDYPGLKGRDLNPLRVGLTLRELPFWEERVKVEAEKKSVDKDSIEGRLQSLGY